MTTDEQTTRMIKHAGWERRFQTAMLALLVSGVIWVVQTLAQVTIDLGAIRPRVDAIDVQVVGMYSARDARRDAADMERRFNEMRQASAHRDSRILDLDERVKKVESATGVRHKP